MSFKALFKDSSGFIQILLLITVISFCAIVINLFFQALLFFKYGISLEAMREIQQNLMNFPDLIRIMTFLQEIGIFIFPALICARLFSDNYKDYLWISGPVKLSPAIWAVISIVVSLPFLNLTYFFNRQMVLPEALKGLEDWMILQEDAANLILEKMLYADHLGVLLFNIAIVCVLTGIGEELMFRGIFQNLAGKFIRNRHVVIWLVAILFSAFHGQFYGFVYRMLLGAWLGYLLYYTKTIWIPILAHFTTNLISVLTYYIYQDTPQKMQEADAIGTGSTAWLSVVSLVLFAVCFRQIRRTRSR
jgi:membrane protease YdiL (CAAX protease family)